MEIDFAGSDEMLPCHISCTFYILKYILIPCSCTPLIKRYQGLYMTSDIQVYKLLLIYVYGEQYVIIKIKAAKASYKNEIISKLSIINNQKNQNLSAPDIALHSMMKSDNRYLSHDLRKQNTFASVKAFFNCACAVMC